MRKRLARRLESGIAAGRDRAQPPGRCSERWQRPDASEVGRERIGPTGRPLPVFPEPEPLLSTARPGSSRSATRRAASARPRPRSTWAPRWPSTGRRVLLVDFDPQGALSVGLGVKPHDLDATIYDLLMERGRHRATTCCSRPRSTAWTCCRATSTCPAPRCSWCTRSAGSTCSAGALAPLLPDYDVVLIDCQPSLGLLTVNALTCARRRDRPAGVRVLRAARGGAADGDHREGVAAAQPEADASTACSATMYDSRTAAQPRGAGRVVDGLRRQGFHTVISRTVRFPETTVAGEPITRFAPTSNGGERLPAARQGGAGAVAAGPTEVGHAG